MVVWRVTSAQFEAEMSINNAFAVASNKKSSLNINNFKITSNSNNNDIGNNYAVNNNNTSKDGKNIID